ncbi:MAG: hypothetical protein WED05_13170 [Candidatus Atabeyarchaeum deiterrae]
MSGKLVVDSKLLLQILKAAVKEQKNIHGLAFSKLVSRYAAELEAEKVDDQNPPSSENIDQCIDYIRQNNGKCPDEFCTIPYGIARAKKLLEGGIGTATRIWAKEGMVRLAEKTGTATFHEDRSGHTTKRPRSRNT